MHTANTKQVRAIVRGLGVAYTNDMWGSYTWTDKCKDENMRRVCFRISEMDTDETVRKVNEALFLAGFTNKARVTNSTGCRHITYSTGGAYLRIKAAFGA